MKTVFFCRFDRAPRQEVNKVIMDFASDRPEFMSSPGCLITIFHTEGEIQEIDEAIKKIEPPVAYFLIDISDKKMELNFPEEFAVPIANYIGLYKYKNKNKIHKLNKEDLEKLLEECIENEEYEKAAEIQAQLKSIE